MNFKTTTQTNQPSLPLFSAPVALPRPSEGLFLSGRGGALVDTRTCEKQKPDNINNLSNHLDSKEFIDSNTGEVVKYEFDKNGFPKKLFSDRDSRDNSRLDKFKLQREASRLLWSHRKNKNQHRTCKCNRVRIDTDVKVFKGDDSGAAHYAGLMQCGSVWTCPICAPKINEKKSAEMRNAFLKALSSGHNVELFTFTFPHYKQQSLKSNLDKLSKARQDFWRSSTMKLFRSQGYIGRIDSFEITHGSNGWHPHIHAIVFTSVDLSFMHSSLLVEWQKQLVKHGLAVNSQSGLQRSLDIRDGSKAGDYICKFGSDGDSKLTSNGNVVNWDIADEVTRSHAKKGRSGSLTPFDFLRLSSSKSLPKLERAKYPPLFREYAKALKGKSQVRWSRGLRDFYQLGEELTDQELVEAKTETARCVAIIDSVEWKQLLQHETSTGENIAGLLLNMAEKSFPDTSTEELIPRFIYDRTHQNASFKSYLKRYYSRTLVQTSIDRSQR